MIHATHYALTCPGCGRRFDDFEAHTRHLPCPSGQDSVMLEMSGPIVLPETADGD
jgi:hypothetical protein